MPTIQLNDVTVEFSKPNELTASVIALKSLSMSIADREFVCILGPSGCGKSTALGLVAGFTKPTAGAVTVDESEILAPGPERGVVFQDANIFPWLNVFDNVAFGLSIHHVPRKEISERVTSILQLVGLDAFGKHLPLELSGGMRQRVGLARVLVTNPPILLMDEPFGALDAQTRIIMQELLLKLWDRDRKTVIFITHDIDEAILLGDRVIVMTARPGRVKEDITIDIQRPRKYSITDTPRFLQLRHRLFDLLHPEAEQAITMETL